MLTKAAICASLVTLTSGLAAIASPTLSLISSPTAPSVQPISLIAQQSDVAEASMPTLVTRRVQKDLAERLNVPFHTLEVVEATRKVWPDSCLGLAVSDRAVSDRAVSNGDPSGCQNGGVRGWQIKVRSAQQTWIYRSDRAAMRLQMEPLAGKATSGEAALGEKAFHRSNDFSTALSQKLLETVSQQTQEPIEKLQVLSVRSDAWDGCLGISTPEATCTQEYIEGFQVIVGNKRLEADLRTPEEWESYWQNLENGEIEKEWVYHLSADGSRIVQNSSASNTQRWAGTYFTGELRYLPVMAEDVVFQMVYNSSATSITTITADGSVSFERTSRYPKESIEREILSQLSATELAEFQQLLEQPQFSDLNGMIYANTNPSLATEGTVYLSTAETTVGFSADKEALPPQLQAVIEALGQFAF